MRPGRGHRLRACHIALTVCVTLGLATMTRAQESLGHGRQKLMGLNIDLFSAATGEPDADIDYLPQVWLGFGGQRVRYIDDQFVWPDGVALALAWFRDYGQDAFLAMGDARMGGDLDPHRSGSHFAMWQRRYALSGVVKLLARDVEPLRVSCGYHWRLAVDFGRAPWIDIVLTPRLTELVAIDASAPIPRHALLEVLWFPCVTR